MTVTRDELEHRVRRTLAEHAARVPSAAPPFVGGAYGDEPRRRKRARGISALAVAAAVVLVVVVAVVGLRPGADRSRPPHRAHVGASSAVAPEPAAVGVATLPAGMQLWSMTTGTSQGGAGARTQQLLSLDGSGSPGGPVMLVSIQHAPPGDVIMPGGPVDATVRGHGVTVTGAKDAASGASGFGFVEGDGEFDVVVRRASTARAVAVLDTLRLRPAATDGFDLGTLPPGVASIGERPAASDAQPSTDATYVYGHDLPLPGTEAELVVWTSTNLGYPGYFRTLLNGEPLGTDGAISFDPDIGATAAWRDGRQVVVGPPSLGESTLRDIASNATMRSSADTTALRRELDRRLAALPLVGQTSGAGVSFRLVGRGSASVDGSPQVGAMCVGTSRPRCYGPTADRYQVALSSVILASMSHDGGWLVAAVGGATPTTFVPRQNGMPAFANPLAPTATSSGGVGAGRWTLGWLLPVPAGVDLVTIFEGPNIVGNATRPAETG